MPKKPDHKNFAAFILTHGRPNNVKTWKALKQSGYTGAIYLVVDDEDKTADEYRRIFGKERVIQFSKSEVAKTFDTADTSEDRRTIVYARNACFTIARELGLDYFVELDDDYPWFTYRWVEDDVIKSRGIKSLDAVIDAMLTFLDESGAASVAFSQGGDHLGGVEGRISKRILRKAMNSFFCRTDRPIEFLGRVNEDVNTYVTHGGRGDLFFTVMGIQLIQTQTQTNEGGMTDVYLQSGTYTKSFYTVMMRPDAVKVRMMGNIDRRYHHQIKWDNAVPKIISSRYRTQTPEAKPNAQPVS